MSRSEEQIDRNLAPVEQQPQEKSLHVVRRLRRAFLSICRCGDVVFSPYRLTTEQYALMRSVLLEPGIRQTEITNRIFAEPNTVTAMVTLLEKRGILRRKSSPTDKRVRQVFLTPHGQAVMHRLSTDWRPMLEILRKYFAGEDGHRALEILDSVAEKMQVEREKMLQTSIALPIGQDEPEMVSAAPRNGARRHGRSTQKTGRAKRESAHIS